VKISSPRTRNAIGCTGRTAPIALDDVKKVLARAAPCMFSMNTGGAFSEVDAMACSKRREAPSGMHGRHAMLDGRLNTGNFFTVKNSGAADWGDKGYCYTPRMFWLNPTPRVRGRATEEPHS